MGGLLPKELGFQPNSAAGYVGRVTSFPCPLSMPWVPSVCPKAGREGDSKCWEQKGPGWHCELWAQGGGILGD